jgi:hypothetical protein
VNCSCLSYTVSLDVRRPLYSQFVQSLTSNAADPINNALYELLANSIMTSRIVVCGIFFPADQQLWVEELAIIASADLIDGRGVKVDEDGTWHVFAARGLSEEGLMGSKITNFFCVGVGTTVSLEAMLEQVQLPGAVSKLCASLANVEVDNLVNGD